MINSAQQRVNNILRQCEWTDENKLLNEYHIPSKNMYLAKALHAHDEWDFVEEYKILLEGGLYEQAKMNLLCFVLPVYFKCKFPIIVMNQTFDIDFGLKSTMHPLKNACLILRLTHKDTMSLSNIFTRL